MGRRSVTAFVVAGCLALGGCSDGGGSAPTSTAAQPASSSSAQSPTDPATVVVFRACHKRHDGSIVLVLLLENRDRALVGGFQGALAFQVSPVDPSTWSTTGGPVTIDPGRNDNVRQITVPPGQTAPAEVTLSVVTTAASDPTDVLATNDASIAVPATSCSSA